MRVFISTIILFFLSLTLLGQVNDANAFFAGTYDKSFIHTTKIRQVVIEVFIQGENSSKHVLDFDKTGLLNKQTILDSSGKKVNEYFFIYNRQADQVERKNIDYQLNKTFTARFDKTYNEALLIKESSSEFPYSTEHRYNSKKQRIESVSILGADSTTAAKSIKLFKYEEDGRLIGTEVLYKQIGQEATTMEKCTYLYNAEGKVITIKRDNSPDYQFSYNKNGLLNSTRVKMPEDLSSLEILDKYSYSFWE